MPTIYTSRPFDIQLTRDSVAAMPGFYFIFMQPQPALRALQDMHAYLCFHRYECLFYCFSFSRHFSVSFLLCSLNMTELPTSHSPLPHSPLSEGKVVTHR